jgi:hypothetical protein
VRRLTLLLALLGSLLFAANASAHGRDSNRDRIPDRWEKQHGLSLKVKQTSRDQDKDGFRNRAEWRAKTDPRDADSDDDGTDDADENAGTVTAFDGTTLTITLFDGGTLTGAVTDETEIDCDDDVARASEDGDDDEGDDRGGECGGDKGDDDPGDDRDDDEHGDDDGDGHHAGQGDDECGPEALTVGAIVEEAELKISSAGREWREIELR